MPKSTHAPSGKRYTPRFSITFADSDYKIVLLLRQRLGGSIRHKLENHAYVLTISSIKGLCNVVSMINGLLRTPKIDKFNSLVLCLVDQGYSTDTVLPLDVSHLLDNAWLAGFLDADGSFDVRVRTKAADGSGKNRVEIRVRVEQRITDPITGASYFSILQSISNVLHVTLNTARHNNGMEYFVVSSTSPAKLSILVNYLSTFPLFTSKYNNYLVWHEVYVIMLANEHVTDVGREKITHLKQMINRKRTDFDWSHLEKLSSY